MKTTFRALTVTVAVEIDDDLPHADLARALIATYPTSDDAVALRYRISRGVLSRDGADDRRIADPLDVIPIFELDLYEQVIARAEPGWILHAAAVAVDGGAVVFAGPSEAGKTTMALALVARGHRLLSEEIVTIDPNGLVCGLSRPLHVRGQEQVPGDWTRIAYPLRERDGSRSEHALVLPPAKTFEHATIPLQAIVRLTHGPRKPTHLLRLEPAVAFGQFWDTTLRPDDSGLGVATTVLCRTPAYELSSVRFGDALEAVDRLFKLS